MSKPKYGISNKIYSTVCEALRDPIDQRISIGAHQRVIQAVNPKIRQAAHFMTYNKLLHAKEGFNRKACNIVEGLIYD